MPFLETDVIAKHFLEEWNVMLTDILKDISQVAFTLLDTNYDTFVQMKLLNST